MRGSFVFFAVLECRPCSTLFYCRRFLFRHQMTISVLQRAFEKHAVRGFALSQSSDISGGTNTVRYRVSQTHPSTLALNEPNTCEGFLKRFFVIGNRTVLGISKTDRGVFCSGGLKVIDSSHLRMQMPKRTTHASAHNMTPTLFHSKGSSIATDVVLFEHDRTRFCRLLSVFCACQLLFWTYLAQFAYTSLRDTTSGEEKTAKDDRLRGDEEIAVFGLSLGSKSWRFGFTIGCLSVGGAIVTLGLLFSRRSVSRVVLHKGGTMVTVTTQSPLGVDKARNIMVPLSDVACHAHRIESPSFIPLRVKGHRFYFLLDKNGKLNNAKLFDTTVGAYRSL